MENSLQYKKLYSWWELEDEEIEEILLIILEELEQLEKLYTDFTPNTKWLISHTQ